MFEVMFKQTRGKYKQNCSPRQLLEEELGYRKEFGCGGALRFVAIAFFNSVQILACQNTRLRSEIAWDAPPPDNDPHFKLKVCGGGGGGASVFIAFWLNYQVGLQSTDYFAPHPFLKIYVSNMPQQHLNLSIPHPETIPSLSRSLRVDQTLPPPPPPAKKNPI